MPKTDLERAVELVKALTAAEQRKLRDLLEVWLAPRQVQATEDELAQELLREGILDHVPRPLTEADVKAFEDYKPVPIEGKPLSETVIEERR
jgi:hypothetical protein